MRPRSIVLLSAAFWVLLTDQVVADLPPAQLPAAGPAVFEEPSLRELSDVDQVLKRAVGQRQVSPAQLAGVRSPTVEEPSLFELSDVGQVLKRAVRRRERSPDELIALAPVIMSSDERCRSIEIHGFCNFNDHARLHFRALYRAPDHYLLLIRDGADGPPLVFVADRHLLIYDPVRPILFYSTAARFTFSIYAVPGQFKLDWKCWWNSSKPSRIEFDIRSLFALFEKQDAAARTETMKTGEGQYFVVRTAQDGGWIRSNIDLARVGAYTDVELFNQRGSPVFSVDRIVINGLLDDEEFAFPAKEKLEEQMTVRDCTEDGLLKNLVDIGMMIRALYARLAAHDPKLRESIKIPGLVGIDWEQVKENDNKYAPLLREALSKK